MSRASHVDPHASVDASALLGDGVSVGAFAVVEAGARVGAGTSIGPHCFVGEGSTLGERCRLEPAVVILAGCHVGDDARLEAGVVVGSAGFGFVHHAGEHRPIPQVGGVELGHRVQVGAGSCIDRGTLDNTRLADDVVIGGQVQIAHNVVVGERSRIEHQAGIAGSSKIGADCTLGLQSGMAGQATLGDRSRLAVRGGLTKKSGPDSDLWGFPARPRLEALRAQAMLMKLAGAEDAS